MTSKPLTRWMVLVEAPGNTPPVKLPAHAHWIKLSDGSPAVSAPVEPVEATADELNAWPFSLQPSAFRKASRPRRPAIAARKSGNTPGATYSAEKR